MKFILYILVAIAMVALYYTVSIHRKIEISKQLIEKAVPFSLTSEDRTRTMLVLGDSTAVGIGAQRKEDSTAGRVAAYIHATYVENYAISGAKVADLPSQIEKAKLDRYSLILIHIGANDIFRFHSARESAEGLRKAIQTLPSAEKIVVATAGNVGGATFFPWFLRPFYTKLNISYHKEFAKVLAEEKGIYINFYEDSKNDPFVKEPEVYLAADGLHPTSEGYRLWFERIAEKLGE